MQHFYKEIPNTSVVWNFLLKYELVSNFLVITIRGFLHNSHGHQVLAGVFWICCRRDSCPKANDRTELLNIWHKRFGIWHFTLVGSPLSLEWSCRSWAHWRPSIGCINLRSQNIRDVGGHWSHADLGPCPPVLRLAHLQRLLHQRVLGHQHSQVWVQVGANGHFTTIPVQSLDYYRITSLYTPLPPSNIDTCGLLQLLGKKQD